MFWVTSRQFFKEKRDRRRDSTLADFIAPLQITVGSAGSSYLINDGKKTSKFLKKAGDVIKRASAYRTIKGLDRIMAFLWLGIIHSTLADSKRTKVSQL